MAIWVIRDLDCYLPEGICYWHSGTPGPKSALESECGPAAWMQDAGVSGGGLDNILDPILAEGERAREREGWKDPYPEKWSLVPKPYSE